MGYESIGVEDVKDNTLLHVAAANGYAEIAKLLLQAGASVTARNNDQDRWATPRCMTQPCKANWRRPRCSLGLAPGECQKQWEQTPLDLAQQHGHGSVAEVLRAAGGQQGGDVP
ncbi:MAG: ankyrin repeat domain-containing protein [Synechococcus sp. SB0678_bin_12]|nr:ankyrin repeat domain-containing protein [Synechococcus sp. SB0678_bin_12]MYI87676.1 ankyrin repeat domain-containing protein [Synechococcus sp. SB0672_bin_10]